MIIIKFIQFFLYSSRDLNSLSSLWYELHKLLEIYFLRFWSLLA